MQCNSCGAANPPDSSRCQRCHIRLAPPIRYQNSAALRKFDFDLPEQRAPEQHQTSDRPFDVLTNAEINRVNTPTQPDLFAYGPQGKVVSMRTGAPAPQIPRISSEAAASDPLYAPSKAAPRRRASTSQSEFNFGPPARRPFSNELKPLQGLSAAPLSVRFYSLLIDALVVAVLSIMFAAAVFVAFRASGETLSLRDLFALPWYLPAAVPVALSLGYKALWAVFEHPTIGLQSFGLDVISMDGHRPTVGQRMVRVFAGWLTVGGMVGALWAVVSQERYSMQDMISQTFLTERPD